ncbi:putative mediator of RNA polymerase II transcription subunit 31-A [Paratrimastix pyriformis]|uniref:Mediator of RNA polymerase II transcription subunit 31 n=1 Tax=Paratrimastix pyriformis TaxID=342808 RepID=A0ABQ8UCC7_9EUKA|nr:putative mediator of RNA polymerase II transcription subunit 31-A [Paratrimastix pyriformis]
MFEPAANSTTVPPPPPTGTNPEVQSLDALRFNTELEFVQLLANPEYLFFLAQRRYFEDNAFLHYLEYLKYWKQPQYARFLVYPQCLFFLDLLKSERFRREILSPEAIAFLRRQQFNSWCFEDTHRGQGDAIVSMVDVIQETLTSNLALQREFDSLTAAAAGAGEGTQPALGGRTGSSASLSSLGGGAACAQCGELEARARQLEEEGTVLMIVKDAVRRAMPQAAEKDKKKGAAESATRARLGELMQETLRRSMTLQLDIERLRAAAPGGPTPPPGPGQAPRRGSVAVPLMSPPH